MAALVLVMLLKPFSGHLQTVDDVDVRFDNNRKYIVTEGDFKVTVWNESGMVYAMVI